MLSCVYKRLPFILDPHSSRQQFLSETMAPVFHIFSKKLIKFRVELSAHSPASGSYTCTALVTGTLSDCLIECSRQCVQGLNDLKFNLSATIFNENSHIQLLCIPPPSLLWIASIWTLQMNFPI